MNPTHETAARLMGRDYAQLSARAQKVARHLADRRPITRELHAEAQAQPTRGQRAADAVARFGGSWAFVALFGGTLVVWIGLNAVLLSTRGSTFDPYPFILLNLVLSMLAAIQAPVILMSQNRQAEKDRLNAEHDYEINLKAELEIMLLHQKVDTLRQTQWEELLQLQRQQLALLAALVPAPAVSSTPPAPAAQVAAAAQKTAEVQEVQKVPEAPETRDAPAAHPHAKPAVQQP